MQAKLFFWAIFLFSFIAMGILYYAYLFDILIALLLCISSFWIKSFLQKYVKYNILSSFLSVFIMVALVFAPLFFVLYRFVIVLSLLDWSNFKVLFDNTKDILMHLLSQIPFVNGHIESMFSNISFSNITGYIVKYSSALGQNSLKFIVDSCFIILFLFVFFCWGESFYLHLKKLLPFNESQTKEVADEVSGTLKIVFLSTFLNVVLQGAAFGIISYIYGFNGLIFGILYGVCSLIPIVGGVIVWLPLCLIVYYQGDLKAAIIIAIYSSVFIGFVIDNVLKPWIIGVVNHRMLKKPLQISEFAIFFAILAGLGAFGFWGIIIGPAITAFFISLLRVYESDFLNK